MTEAWWPRVVLVALLVLAGACSSDDSSSAPHNPGLPDRIDTTQALAESLNVVGIDCARYQDTTAEDEGDIGEQYVAGKAECDHDGKSFQLFAFKDKDHTKAHLKALDGACVLAKGFGLTEFNVAYGDTWEVSYEDTIDQAIPRQVAEGLGGDTKRRSIIRTYR